MLQPSSREPLILSSSLASTPQSLSLTLSLSSFPFFPTHYFLFAWYRVELEVFVYFDNGLV